MKDDICTKIEVPLDLINILPKKNLREDLKTLEEGIFPIYSQFSKTINSKKVIIARGMFFEEKPSILTSADCLIPYKRFLRNHFKKKIKVKFHATYEEFIDICRIDYCNEGIINFGEEKQKEDVLKKIVENALAYYYWCWKNINQRKRIGFIGYTNGELDLSENFKEFEMQRFFPDYDYKKAFSLDENDFLCNAPERQIGEQFVEIICDFKEELKNKKRKSVLLWRLKQIEEYSSRLKYNSKGLVEKIVGKDFESFY